MYMCAWQNVHLCNKTIQNTQAAADFSFAFGIRLLLLNYSNKDHYALFTKTFHVSLTFMPQRKRIQ